ncbi:lung seven transmembrane receptor-domain-containing protein [Paraphysoderma sedebokerense]|nr:lung seven transmembrane receptor-domain-containing protein [Paraphysoderma sedebokerense]
MIISRTTLSALAIVLLFVISVQARSDLVLTTDDRKVIPILGFGFLEGGKLAINISDWNPSNSDSSAQLPPLGLYIRRSAYLPAALDLENSNEPCPLTSENRLDSDIILRLDTENFQNENEKQYLKREERSILYQRPIFKQDESYWHVYLNSSLLSAGDYLLPNIYSFMSFLYAAFLITWIIFLRKASVTVLRIHKLISVFLIFLLTQKILESARYNALKSGIDAEGYTITTYIFTFLKSLLGITILLLLASGWSLLKPILSSRDRRIMMGIIPIQILVNIVKVLEEEGAVGSVEWEFWRTFLPLIDVFSFFIILWVILHTRRHLTQASRVDGKAFTSLLRHKLWGQLYILTCVYIYMTRVVSIFLESSLQFKNFWVVTAWEEGVGLIFWGIVASKFRPTQNNPYTRLDLSPDDDAMDLERNIVQLDDLVFGEEEEDSVHSYNENGRDRRRRDD